MANRYDAADIEVLSGLEPVRRRPGMYTDTTYTLDIPELPAGEDAIDHYLFQTHQGFCEQIGSSLAIMLRSQGIPARLVVGYVPGTRNPFTGLYEVRASDAHSWTEVYFPGVGWQGFDPTAEVPLADDAVTGSAAAGMGEFFAQRLGQFARYGTALIAGLVLIVFGATFWALGNEMHRKRRSLRELTWAGRMFRTVDEVGSKHGLVRSQHQTSREYCQALVEEGLADPDLLRIIELISRDAISGTSLSDQERSLVTAELDHALERQPV